MFTTIRAALVSALALALLLPAAANAKQFNVSRDVGVYADANTGKGLGVIDAGKPVDVQCWRNGQSVQGYAIWDRIAFDGGTAYVHDKYVEMPNGSPEAEGIPECPAGGQSPAEPEPEPEPSRCVRTKWVHYLAIASRHVTPVVVGPDEHWQSPFHASWKVRFCPRGDSGDYTITGRPDVRERGPYSLLVNFELGEGDESDDGRRVVYAPKVRACPAAICFTAARVRLIATLTGDGIRIDRSVETRDSWRNTFGDYFAWRHKPDQKPPR
jgi:hypothetical protein